MELAGTTCVFEVISNVNTCFSFMGNALWVLFQVNNDDNNINKMYFAFMFSVHRLAHHLTTPRQRQQVVLMQHGLCQGGAPQVAQCP